MTLQEKELLLKDLCMRLPYGVKVEHLLHAPNNPSDLFAVDMDKQLLYCDHKGREEWYKVEYVKPYLRPMSSMTEEERKEYELLANRCITNSVGFIHFDAQELINWLLKNYFDFMGLIPKGLAIEVTEENNTYK